MKKRVLAFLLVVVMVLSFSLPVMATSEAIIAEPINITSTTQEISPHTEMTQIFTRNYNGVLQWRVWSITNARWLTEWANV